jgi:hypothetical protein
MKKTKSQNARRTITSSAREINSQRALLFHDDNHKRRATHSAFCSRDQIAEARNAMTCALTSFALTSIAIRHAARDTTRGWRKLLKRPLADDVPCSRDHSQNILATMRVVVLHTHVFCLPIALSARATTRRRRLLEKLADRSSQTGGAWETA